MTSSKIDQINRCGRSGRHARRTESGLGSGLLSRSAEQMDLFRQEGFQVHTASNSGQQEGDNGGEKLHC